MLEFRGSHNSKSSAPGGRRRSQGLGASNARLLLAAALAMLLISGAEISGIAALAAAQPTRPQAPAQNPGNGDGETGSPQTELPAGQAEPPADPSQGFRIGVEVNQVYLSVNARSLQTGGFVKGLTKEDFHIWEDGVPQEITNLDSEAVRVHVAILLDISGSVQSELPEFRRAILNFARALSPDDRIAIVTFNDRPKLILDWTADPEKIELAANSVYSKGPTVFYDALYVTFNDLLKGVAGRKAVIVLTDAIDTASITDFQKALRLAIRSEAMVYFVSKLDRYAAEAMEARLTYPWEPSFRDSFLQRVRSEMSEMATQTGGAVLNYIAMSLNDIYQRVAEELRNQYYIGYLPSNRTKDGSWRRVQIQVLKPGVQATTRAGYYAPAQ
ncbi:MAG: VWA domain-containing protein [Acidobacteria bacterium]|nr:VWA domain-containing protein [Acidobacteriota bacterium]